MNDYQIEFSHPVSGGLMQNQVDQLADLIAKELEASDFARIDDNRYQIVYFDTNVDHDMEIEIFATNHKGLVSGKIGLDSDSPVTKKFFSNAAWGLVLVALFVGLIAESFWWGVGAALLIAVIDYSMVPGIEQQTRSRVKDAIDRAYIKL